MIHRSGARDVTSGVRVLVQVLALVLLAALGPLPAHAADEPAEAPAAGRAVTPTRVLLTGDSITQAAYGRHSWRYFAWRWVTDTDFVGNKTGPFDLAILSWDSPRPGRYADENFDVDHAASWGGRLIHQLDGATVDPAWETLPIGTLVTTYQPEVIVSLWGINDLNAGLEPWQVIGRYRTWIRQARAADPDVDFVLGRLAWTWASAPGRVDRFNELLGELARELGTARSRIVVAAAARHYQRADTYDDTHPRTSGERKIASVMLTALDRLGVPVRLTAPTAPAWIRATREGRDVVVRWGEPARAKRYVVRCGDHVRWLWATQTRFRESGAVTCRVRALNAVGSSAWSSRDAVPRR